MPHEKIDAREIRKFVDYDPQTGRFVWLKRNYGRFDTSFAGKPAFCQPDSDGYLGGSLFNRNYKAHHVAYAYVFGMWPEQTVDHINGVRDDNRITNLRACSQGENRKNLRRARRDLPLGVYQQGKMTWKAIVKIDGKATHLGTFTSIDDASAARKAAEQRLGYHPNHGCEISELLDEARRRNGDIAA